MKKEVKFSRLMSGEGRNGLFKCSGVEMVYFNKKIRVTGLTSRGYPVHGFFDIPVEDVASVIEALREVAANAD